MMEMERGNQESERGPVTRAASKKARLDGRWGAASGGDNNGNGPGDQQIHPLYNSVILSNLFRVMPPALLPNCRQVCRTWHDVSLPVWRSSATLQLESSKEDGGPIYVGGAPSKTKTTLRDFLDWWENDAATARAAATTPPYQNFTLKSWQFGALQPRIRTRNQRMGDRFLDICGRAVKRLSLLNCNFFDVHEFRRIIYDNFPNLQSLRIDNPRIPSYSEEEWEESPEHEPADLQPVYGEKLHLTALNFSCGQDNSDWIALPVSWVELLSHFPRLTFFEMFDDCADRSEIEKCINAISLIKSHDRRKLPLKHINFFPYLSVSDHPSGMINTLSQLALPLHTFKIELVPDLDMEQVKEVTAEMRQIVKNIAVIEAIPAQFLPLSILFQPFPFGMELTTLQTLTLLPIFCSSMEFLKYTPNLRKLRILDDWNENDLRYTGTRLIANTDQGAMKDVKLVNLKEFGMSYVVTLADLKRLVDWFPNVEKLTMYLDNAQLGVVCEHWRELSHLHVLGADLTDAGITGVGTRRGRIGGAREIIPNITWLKNLRCFKIALSRSKLSTTSLRHGFLKLDHLQVLDIIPRGRVFGCRYEGMKSLLMGAQNLASLVKLMEDDNDELVGGPRWFQLNCGYSD